MAGGVWYPDHSGGFTDAGDVGEWRTATKDGSNYVYIRYMNPNDDIGENSRDDMWGLSVRCIRD
jgi:hypothetical protein